MARRPTPLPPDDDGETIVDMNVEGMPWYMRRPEKKAAPESSAPYQMTKEEQRAYTWAAVRTGLLIALIFGAVFAAFIAFCDFIWFR